MVHVENTRRPEVATRGMRGWRAFPGIPYGPGDTNRAFSGKRGVEAIERRIFKNQVKVTKLG